MNKGARIIDFSMVQNFQLCNFINDFDNISMESKKAEQIEAVRIMMVARG